MAAAAARVDDDVAVLEVELGNVVDVVATLLDDVGGTGLRGDNDESVPSVAGEVAYGCCKHALTYEIMTRLTEVAAEVCNQPS